MARIERSEVEKREEFVRSMFVADPGLSMTKANDKLHEKFKARMRPQRIYEIRRDVQTQLVRLHKANFQPPKTEESYTAARLAPQFGKVDAANSKASLLNVGTGNEEIAKRIIDGLHQDGLFQGRVEHTFNGYLVVVNA